MTLPSPCIDRCEIDPDSDLCRGCFRTLTEIAAWSGMSDGKQRDVVAKLKARKDGLSPASG